MRLLLLVPVLLLGACAQEPKLPKAWARADGRPVVSGLLDIATLDCKDEVKKPAEDSDNLGETTGSLGKSGNGRDVVENYVSCMRGHGYVQIKS
jgi:hypothetical protein